MKKITAVISTFNRKEYLRQLVKQLYGQRLPSTAELSIIIINDGSTDGTHEMIKSEFPGVIEIKGDGNLWFTKSVNLGTKYAVEKGSDFVLILNDDLELPDDYLNSIFAAYNELKKECIVGSISLTYELPHRITFSGITGINKIFLNLKRYHDNFQEADIKTLKGIYPSKVLPGRGMLIPISVIKKLGYLDETFRQYHSDFDFCLRAAKKGIEVYVSWESIVFSHHKSTSTSTSYLGGGFTSLIKSYFYKYSRRYLVTEIKYYLRHGVPILLPIFLTTSFILDIKNFVIKKTKVN